MTARRLLRIVRRWLTLLVLAGLLCAAAWTAFQLVTGIQYTRDTASLAGADLALSQTPDSGETQQPSQTPEGGGSTQPSETPSQPPESSEPPAQPTSQPETPSNEVPAGGESGSTGENVIAEEGGETVLPPEAYE